MHSRGDVEVEEPQLGLEVGARRNSPLTQTPALSATALTGRPVVWIADQSASTRLYVARSARTGCTCAPDALSAAAASDSRLSSELTTRSNPFAANYAASS